MSNTEQIAVSADVVAGAAMSPGDRLRAAREARGESQSDVAQTLKLSMRQVEALERGDYEALPGPAFVRGFMRNYARHLGIDPAPLLAALNEGAVAAQVELAPVSNADGDMPSGGGHGRNASGPAAIVAVFLLLAVLAGWYFDWFQTEPPASLTGDTQSEPEMPPRGDVAVEPIVVAPPAPAPTDAVAPTPGMAVPQPIVEPQALSPSAPPPAAVPQVPQPAAAPATDGAAQAVPDSESPQLTFRFAGESWVEVRDAAGTVVYSGLGSAGSSRNVQGRPPFALVVGNAKDVRLELNGREIDLQSHTRGTVARLKVQ